MKGPEARVSYYFYFELFRILFLLDVIVKGQQPDMKDKQLQTSTNERHIGIVRKFM